MVAQRGSQLEPLGLLDRQVEHHGQPAAGLLDRQLGLFGAQLGQVALDFDFLQLVAGDQAVGLRLFQDPGHRAQPLAAGRGEADGFAGRHQVDISDVQVVDLHPHGVLVLGLERLLGPRGHFGVRQPLVADVERIDHRGAVVGLARPGRRVAAVGDRSDAGEHHRIGPQAGREHVGAGLGDFEGLGSQVDVVADQDFDGPVERQAAGGPLFLAFGHFQRSVDGQGFRLGRPAGNHWQPLGADAALALVGDRGQHVAIGHGLAGGPRAGCLGPAEP